MPERDVIAEAEVRCSNVEVCPYMPITHACPDCIRAVVAEVVADNAALREALRRIRSFAVNTPGQKIWAPRIEHEVSQALATPPGDREEGSG